MALILAGFTLLGYQSYADLESKIKSATNDVEPILKEAREKAKEIAKQSGSLSQELNAQRTQLEAIKVINQEVFDLSRKVARLEDNAFKAEPSVPRERIAAMQAGLTGFRIYLAGLGYVSTKHITVSVGSDLDNARYEPKSGNITIGKLFMYDQDALLSTYMQGALMEIQPWTLTGDNPVVSQLIQGLPDYLACSYLGDPKVSLHGGTEIQKRDGGPATPLRDLETQRRFAERLSDMEAHDGGEVWAATLWQLRQRLGQATVDRLAFDAWRELKPEDKDNLQTRFVARMIEVDRRLNAGENVGVITRAFVSRGLRGSW